MRKLKFTGIPSRIMVALMLFILGCQPGIDPLTGNQKKLREYNIIWDSPSHDYNGSMPLGNGDIGLNVWVEENGDICFYIGKTDSWGDNGRLKKVGRVRVRSNPAIVFKDSDFKQELDLLSGTIKISSSGQIAGEEADFSLQVWVDANNPVIHVNHESSIPLELSAEIELWRTEPYSLPELTVSDLLEDRSKPGNMRKPVIVEPYIWRYYNRNRIGPC